METKEEKGNGRSQLKGTTRAEGYSSSIRNLPLKMVVFWVVAPC
jgi:hypothetical protein